MTSRTLVNRINRRFEEQKGRLLSVYFTAGFPSLDDTVQVIKSLQRSGADMIEIGIPFSDPIADGPTIQSSNQQALDNGMNVRLLFEQLRDIRNHADIPILLMGYLNPIYQFGIESFCAKCSEVGIDGLIIPDLPVAEYLRDFQSTFQSNGLHNIFLVSPNTSEDRIREIDQISSAFIYMVSSSSTTGAKDQISDDQTLYFKRVKQMNLRNPRLIGFGISNRETFDRACQYAEGAIIGSSFIKLLSGSKDLEGDIAKFVRELKN